ncbi:MAG: metallophosphoesterase [Arcobacteraceae bacterium]|nr:metallophosphoesterase [Arcobacteraceae bacterium]
MNLPNHQEIKIFTSNKNICGLKILHLSDLHINKNTSSTFIEDLVSICNSLEYDIAVITGDILDCKVSKIEDKLLILNQLRNIFCVSGNHDLVYGLENMKVILSNFTFMDNNCIEFTYNKTQITLCGLPDRFSRFFGHKRDEDFIIKQLSSSDGTILLAHQPKDYKFALKSNCSLFLCGHTHGGQIFPFHYIVRLFQPFLSGLFYKDKTAIYVNKGLGTWGIHKRYKADSEITILNIIHK